MGKNNDIRHGPHCVFKMHVHFDFVTKYRREVFTKEVIKVLLGNEACVEAALLAGCRFYGGYPITPATEILEIMSRRLPLVDGLCLQMEDEIAALVAVVGASWGGTKAMTATSGPGFCLMQEAIGLAVAVEAPCVVVNVMRGGPASGQSTSTAQGDFYQARYGSIRNQYPIVLDMSTSVVARGKIRYAALTDQSIPLGWARDIDGKPTQDAQLALKGSLEPVGGVKGSALSLIIDMICGVLTDTVLTGGVKNITDISGPSNKGHFFSALNVSRFIDTNRFKAHMDQVIDYIKSLPAADGGQVFMPGEIEYN